jgi:hypothetical protein
VLEKNLIDLIKIFLTTRIERYFAVLAPKRRMDEERKKEEPREQPQLPPWRLSPARKQCFH